MTIAAAALLTALACAAALGDLRERKVRNRLNLAILVCGLGWRALSGDLSAVGLGLAGTGVGLLMLFPAFAVRWVGAGDVKLLAALGAWLGPVGTLWAGLIGLAAGGVLSAAIAVAGGAAVRREVGRTIAFSMMTMTAPVAPRRAKTLVVPLAVPLGAAAVAVFTLRGF
jgi:prepilin peptidase CpaA